VGVVFDEGVCGDQQLSRNSYERELGGLSLASQVKIGELHRVIMPARHQSGHVEGGTNAWTAARDGGPWRSIAGLTDMRSQTRETGNGSAIGTSDLG